jgi:hypothetical protein
MHYHLGRARRFRQLVRHRQLERGTRSDRDRCRLHPGTVVLTDAFKVDNLPAPAPPATFDHLEIANGAFLAQTGATISEGSVTLDLPNGYCCVSTRIGGNGTVVVHGTLTSNGGRSTGPGRLTSRATGR